MPLDQSGPLLRIAACPQPFSSQRIDLAVPVGLSLAEIVAIAIPDPAWHAHAVVIVGDERVPHEWWPRVRPKAGTYLAVHILPRSGGGARVWAMVGVAVLAIALAVAAPYLTPLIASGLAVSMTTAGAIYAGASAAVIVGASLAVNMLIPPPMPQVSRDAGQDKPAWAISGGRNRAEPWGKVPFLLGRFRVTPPYAAIPYREIVGGDIYWRALFAISHGPVAIEQMLIGETDLGAFGGVETEFRRGYWSLTDRGAWDPQTAAYPTSPAFADTWTASQAGSVGGVAYKAGETITYNGLDVATSAAAWDRDQGQPFKLYPTDVFEEGLAVAVETTATRTTQLGADEIGVELIFARGLCHIQNDPPGKRSDRTVQIRIRQRPAAGGSWATVATRTITGRQLTPLYVGHRWKSADYGAADANGQYEVEIANLSGNHDEERNFGNFSWIALRTVTTQNPVPVGGIAMLAVRILASGQLQGVLDELRVIARTIARDYDVVSDTWDWRPTSQPSALCRHVLQHPARQRPAADAAIDLVRLSEWDTITRDKGRLYNGVVEAKGSLWQALVDVCRVGRATPSLRDLIFSVVIDQPQGAPVRLFTPRNSWAYEGEIDHGPLPHAYRIGYLDAEREWKADEVVVYDDGQDVSTATRIERVEWPGITSRAQAWKEGRYHLAQRRLRREIHRIMVDFEHLACERGDLVALSHDIIAVGLGAARITARADDGVVISTVTLDNPVVMADGTDYGLRVRRVVGAAQITSLYRVATEAGTQATLTLAEPADIAEAPGVGDLCAFGEHGRETLRVLVRDIEPRADLTARVSLIGEGAGVHTAGQGTIPPYDPMVSRAVSIPAPVVTEVKSDTSVMLVTASRTLVERVVFTLAPVGISGTTMHVLYRPSATAAPWAEATVQEETPTSVAIVGVTSGESYDFRLARTHPDYLASPATTVTNHLVVGRSADPAALQNLTLAVVGGQALLRWDTPADLDVQYGGWILFRHAPAMSGATWANSTSLGRAVNGDQTHVYLPLKSGTYLARVYDSLGNVSALAGITTKQASILAFSPVDELVEDPGFTGDHDDTEVLSSALQLRSGDFDTVVDTDELADWDLGGLGIVSSGTYGFSAGLDFGSVRNVRLTGHVAMTIVNALDLIDERTTPIDDWPDIDGTDAAVCDAAIWAQTSDDDPAGSPVWGPWLRIDSAEVTCRAVGNVECRLSTTDPTFNLEISELRLKAEAAI